PPLDHVEDVEPRHRLVCQLVALVHAAEETPLGVAGDPRSPDVGVQVALKAWMAGHLMAFAALFVQPEPQPLPMLEKVANPHRHRRTHPGETVDHDPNERPVT